MHITNETVADPDATPPWTGNEDHPLWDTEAPDDAEPESL